MSAVNDTAEKILVAASELFAERGYAATSTRAIAERAGVNEVTLFRRFENKRGILKAIGERFAERAAARAVATLPDPADARGTLLSVARREIADSMENGGVALRLAFDAQSVPEVGALMGDGPGGNVTALAAYIADRQAAGQIRDDIDPELIAESLASLTSSYVMYRTIMGFLDKPGDAMTDEKIEQLFDIFWSGVASRG